MISLAIVTSSANPFLFNIFIKHFRNPNFLTSDFPHGTQRKISTNDNNNDNTNKNGCQGDDGTLRSVYFLGVTARGHSISISISISYVSVISVIINDNVLMSLSIKKSIYVFA